MTSTPPIAPVAAVAAFIDAINTGDVDALVGLMAVDHELRVLDESPLVGRDANRDAWRGYASSFPSYVIYPHEIVQRGAQVAVLGHTTGSHLGLPDDEESKLLVIWLAEVVDGRLRSWRVCEDTPEQRRSVGLTSDR